VSSCELDLEFYGIIVNTEMFPYFIDPHPLFAGGLPKGECHFFKEEVLFH
jgi:hypothetical protein